MDISVIIPVYNSERSLRELIRRLQPVLQKLALHFELILINDGSRDQSWKVIDELTRQHRWIRGINLMRNFGQHNALLCGIRAAQYEITVTMDDDLQHPPEEIPKLIEKLAVGYDVVYGTPQREKHSLWRNLASIITKLVLQKTMGAMVARNVSAFRAFKTSLRDAFAHYQSPFVSIHVLLTWGTTNFGAVSVRHDPRSMGVSNYTFRNLIFHALNMMTSFSTFPLQLASLIGFAFTFFGLGILVYVLWRYLTVGGNVPGFPFLASVIAIFSGAQLFTLGIMGEYLARIHLRMMDRPTYIVRDDTGTRE